MTNERCRGCPYETREKGLTPCAGCMGSVPYEEYFMKIIIDDVQPIISDIIKGCGKNWEDRIKVVLQKIYCDAQDGRIEREYMEEKRNEISMKIKEEMIKNPNMMYYPNLPTNKDQPGGMYK